MGVRGRLVHRCARPAGGERGTRAGYGRRGPAAHAVRRGAPRHHRAGGRGDRDRRAVGCRGARRPGGAERRNRRHLHGPRAAARARARGSGAADHAVPFRRVVGGAARRGAGGRVPVRGQAGDELVRAWAVGRARGGRDRRRMGRGAGGSARRRRGRRVARDRRGVGAAGL